MPLNKDVLTWRAPTRNVDGTPIDYELAYEVEVDGQVDATFPGRLNADGLYEQPTDTFFDNVTNASYRVRLRALRIDQPTLKSAWSNEVVYVYDRRVPEAPFLLE